MDQGRPVPQKAEPPVKVVGFHVEGASPSPQPNSLRDALKTGSMSPVMIPPSFQVPSLRPPDLSPKRVTTPTGPTISAATPFSGGEKSPQPQGRRSQDTIRSPKGGLPPQGTFSAPATVTTLSNEASSSTFSPRRPSTASPRGANTSESGATPRVPTEAPSSKPAAASEKAGGAAPGNQGGRPANKPEKKKLTKAETRARQEAERAAKEAAKEAAKGGKGGGSSAGGGGAGAGAPSGRTPLQKTSSTGSLSRNNTMDSRASGGDVKAPRSRKDTASGGTSGTAVDGKAATVSGTAPAAARASSKHSRPLELFAHLPQYKSVTVESVAERAASANVPIECVRLGLQMADGSVRGANSRCEAMLDVFAAAIKGFRTPPGKIFAREFGAALNSMVAFLVSCRPLSPAMGNVVKAVKAELGRIGANPALTDHEAHEALLNYVATFAQEKVKFASEALARIGKGCIADGDVILTYARSSTVESVLLAAAAAGTNFTVVVIDSRPLLEGRALLPTLLQAGIPCEYVLINGMLPVLSNVTKVMLGAGAVMSNGAVLSRVGTAAVAMSAAAAHVPVMVCSETFKFHDRVQLDSVTYNELGDPEALVKGTEVGVMDGWRDDPNLSLLNIEYDTTPAEFVTVVVTEVGLLPPTSVPVVLREYRTDEMA